MKICGFVFALFILFLCSCIKNDFDEEISFSSEPKLISEPAFYIDTNIVDLLTYIVNYKYFEKYIIEAGHCWSKIDTNPSIWSSKEICEVLGPDDYFSSFNDYSEYYIHQDDLVLPYVDTTFYIKAYLIFNDSIILYGNTIITEK